MKRIGLSVLLAISACSRNAPEGDADLQQAFTDALKDPSSLQFQNVSANAKTICGQYNAKNSFGAYAGFTIFAFERASKKLWLADSEETRANYKQYLDALYRCDNSNVGLTSIEANHAIAAYARDVRALQEAAAARRR